MEYLPCLGQERKRRKKALYDALLGVRRSARGISLTREDLDFLFESGFLIRFLSSEFLGPYKKIIDKLL